MSKICSALFVLLAVAQLYASDKEIFYSNPKSGQKSDAHIRDLLALDKNVFIAIGDTEIVKDGRPKQRTNAVENTVTGLDGFTNHIYAEYVKNPVTGGGLIQQDDKIVMTSFSYRKALPREEAADPGIHYYYQVNVAGFDASGNRYAKYPIVSYVVCTNRKVDSIDEILSTDCFAKRSEFEIVKALDGKVTISRGAANKSTAVPSKANFEYVYFVDSPDGVMSVKSEPKKESDLISTLTQGSRVLYSSTGGTADWCKIKLQNGTVGFGSFYCLTSCPPQNVNGGYSSKKYDHQISDAVSDAQKIGQIIQIGKGEDAMTAYPTFAGLQRETYTSSGRSANYFARFDSIDRAIDKALFLKNILTKAFQGTWENGFLSLELSNSKRRKANQYEYAKINAIRIIDSQYEVRVIFYGWPD